MTSNSDRAPETVAWDRTASDDDIYGVARYLADAVVHGDITAEDGENALLEWAGPDRHVLERAARRSGGDSETGHLLRAAYHRAA